MIAHTPGPWEARPDQNACLPDDWCVGTGPENIDKVAVCSKCDAHLIAAAPELLEALDAMVKMIDYAVVANMNGSISNRCPTTEKARAAIAKAEGTA